MLSDGVVECVIEYPTSEVGTPPFINVMHYEPLSTAFDPADLVDELSTSFVTAWNDVIANLDGGLTGITATFRYLFGGIVYEKQASMANGQASGSQVVGGGSCRLKFITQHGPKQRNGGIYLPALAAAATSGNAGTIDTTWRNALITDLAGIEALTTVSTTFQLVVMSKDADSDPATYTPRAVDSIVPATKVTFYDSRYT